MSYPSRALFTNTTITLPKRPNKPLELIFPSRCEECGAPVKLLSTTYPPTFRCEPCEETTKVYREGWVTERDAQ
jgi:hypothetical protein